MGDYRSAAGVIVTARTLKRWAFTVFLLPLLGAVLSHACGMTERSVLWVVGLGLPAGLLFMKLRVPTPRIRWEDDFRGPLLVLRSFADERLKTGHMIYPADFDPGPPARNNHVWQAALALWDTGRVVIVQREHETVTPIFGIVIESDADSWRGDVARAAQGAWAILVFPSSTPGIVEEMQLLRSLGLLWKTVVFMPAAESDVDYAARWQGIRQELLSQAIHLPEYDPRGMFYLPDDEFRAARSIDLRSSTYPWLRLRELVDPSAAHAKGLIDCLAVDRAREM